MTERALWGGVANDVETVEERAQARLATDLPEYIEVMLVTPPRPERGVSDVFAMLGMHMKELWREGLFDLLEAPADSGNGTYLAVRITEAQKELILRQLFLIADKLERGE